MDLNSRNIKIILLIITFTVVLFTASQNIPAVVWGVSWLFAVVAPIVAGLCIAFVLNVPLRVFEERVFRFFAKSKRKWIRKLQRPVSLIATMLSAFGLITLLLLVIIPEIKTTVITLTEKLPEYIDSTAAWIDDTLASFNIKADVLSDIEIDWEDAIAKIQQAVLEGSGGFINTATGVTSSIVNWLMNAVLGIIIAVYVLAEKEKVGGFVKKLLTVTLPQKAIEKIMRIAAIANTAFANFITGQLIEAVILGTLCFIGMLIFGFPYAAAISVLVGMTALIPVVGALIGEIVGAFLILMVNPLKALLFLVFIFSLQTVEGNFIYPKVVGKTVGLPGLLVLLAVIVGGNLAGMTGLLLSVPVCSILYSLSKELFEARLTKKGVLKKKEKAV